MGSIIGKREGRGEKEGREEKAREKYRDRETKRRGSQDNSHLPFQSNNEKGGISGRSFPIKGTFAPECRIHSDIAVRGSLAGQGTA